MTRHTKGLTLVELLVGTFIALFLTAAAVLFASHETKLLGYSNEQIDLEQAGRNAIDQLTLDLQMAGAGIGYSPTGAFLGLQTGTFTVPGGAIFNAKGTDQTIDLIGSDTAHGANYAAKPFTVSTQDLQIVTADGPYASIAHWQDSSGEYCHSNDVAFRVSPPEQVLLRDAPGLVLVAGSLRPGALRPGCTYGTCPMGCIAFAFSPNPGGAYLGFASEPDAASAQFTDGEVMGFEAIAYFVANQRAPYEYAGQLRRVRFNGSTQCATREACGGNAPVAAFVESLAYQVWEFTPGAWRVLALGGPLQPSDRRNRLRVDIEVAVRSRVFDDRPHEPAIMRLRQGTCIPGGGTAVDPNDPATCPGGRGAWDLVVRRVYRATVEIKNSGRGASE